LGQKLVVIVDRSCVGQILDQSPKLIGNGPPVDHSMNGGADG
jgi:hypothetical protein